jgi:hypothetical protein
MIHLTPHMILVVPSVRVVGGKRIRTKTLKETGKAEAVTIVKESVIEYDNRGERKKAEDFAAKARNLARNLAVYSPLGYLIDAANRPQLEAKIKQTKDDAEALNKKLTAVRVEVGVALLDVQLTISPDVSKLVTNHVKGELERLKTALTGGAEDSRNIYNNVRNIGILVTGVQSDCIKYALEEARDAIKAKKATENLPNLDNAIAMFSPVDPLSMPEAL